MAVPTRTPKRRTIRTTTSGEEPLRAIVYTRLSKAKSKPGDTEVGLETQLAGCERAVAALGGSIVAVEQDIQSGDRLDRPGLWRAIERIQTGEANALIVYAVDRFGRDQVQQGVAIHSIRLAGGRLLSATENLEEGPLGDLLRSVYGFAGAVELEKIRERTNRGLDAKFRQAGKYKPGPRPPYGYRRTGSGPDAVYDVDPADAAIVRRIFVERAAGASIQTIINGLHADGIPTPSGTGQWGQRTVATILGRSAYSTGEHEAWRTRTVRDAAGVPYLEARPADERYTVPFPPLIDPALADRARATATRNVWKSARHDRPAEVGILRFGFARCSACGRAMAVVPRSGGPHYACTRGAHPTHPCPTTASISVELLDAHILGWLQQIIEDPTRAEAFRVERRPATPDAEALAAAIGAERAVADLEQQAAALAQNLALVSGAAAQIVAERLNALNDDLIAARAERDRLAAACRVTVSEDALALSPQDTLAATVLDAIQAMIAADPEPEHTFPVLVPVPDGAAEYVMPLSWRAWQAALSVLGVTVAVARRDSGLPRWVAEMRLPAGVTVTSPAADGYLSLTPWCRRC